MIEDNEMEQKPWYKSKTVWFNIITVMGAAAGGVVGLMPTIQPLLTPQTYSVVMFAIGVINVGLRAVTKNGITIKA